MTDLPSPPENSFETEDAPDPLAFRVFNEISIIAQISSNMLERALPGELKMAHFVVLNHFVRLGGQRTPLELARAFQISKGAMTNTLQRLEAQGLITIAPDDKDGRVKRVSITQAGREMREASVAAVAPFIEKLHQAFDPQELSAILPLLERLRGWVGAEREDMS